MFGCSAADAEVDSAAGAAIKGALVKSVDGTSPLSCPKTTEAKSVHAPKIVRFMIHAFKVDEPRGRLRTVLRRPRFYVLPQSSVEENLAGMIMQLKTLWVRMFQFAYHVISSRDE